MRKMRKDLPTFSAGFVNRRQGYYWVVLSPKTHIFRSPDDALAEGYEQDSEDAWSAACNAAKALGIPFERGSASEAGYFHWSHRGGKESARPRRIQNIDGPPQTTTFQGSPHLWHYSSGFDDHNNEYVDYWNTHLVVRVTKKYVFVFMGEMQSLKRLDRSALERDGCATSDRDTFYTEARKDVLVAEAAEKKRLEKEARDKRKEETRISLIGKTCRFCSGEPELYTIDQQPSCRPCHRAHHGYYQMPGNVVIPFASVGK